MFNLNWLTIRVRTEINMVPYPKGYGTVAATETKLFLFEFVYKINVKITCQMFIFFIHNAYNGGRVEDCSNQYFRGGV